MAKKQTTKVNWLQAIVLSVTRVHFAYVGLYAFITILSDAWNLIPRELVYERWMMAAAMLVITTTVWYLARANLAGATYYRVLTFAIILMDIAVATFTIYTERGMSSRGVALYAIPIIVSAVLLNRAALFGTAALSTAAYIGAATRYFFVYFNEGYKIELYTTLILYSASFFILASLLWIVLREKASS
jgi:hypothetical protein